MRYQDKGDAGAGSVMAENRVAMVSDLLGITTWKPGRASALAGQPGETVIAEQALID
jgi:hypothetical protein